MRVSPHHTQHMHPDSVRGPANRARGVAESAERNAVSAAATAAQEENSPAKAAKNVSEPGKTVPPGLERVLNRLQSMPTSELNSGHSKALASISRNIARYTEMQSIGMPPAATPATPPAETGSIPAPESAEPAVPVADATPAATPEMPPAEPATSPVAGVTDPEQVPV